MQKYNGESAIGKQINGMTPDPVNITKLCQGLQLSIKLAKERFERSGKFKASARDSDPDYWWSALHYVAHTTLPADDCDLIEQTWRDPAVNAINKYLT